MNKKEQIKKPFLERETDITDLKTLNNRINALERCISNCDEDIIRYTNNIDSLGSTHFEISMLKYMSGLDNKTDAAIITALTEYLQGKILEAKELKQSCNDELHWLEVRIGI